MSCRETAITSIARTALTWAPEGKRPPDHEQPGEGVQRESRRRWDGSHGGPQWCLPETGMGGEHL